MSVSVSRLRTKSASQTHMEHVHDTTSLHTSWHMWNMFMTQQVYTHPDTCGTCSWHKSAQNPDTHGTCPQHNKSAQQTHVKHVHDTTSLHTCSQVSTTDTRGMCSWHKSAQQSYTHGTCSWHNKSAQQSDTHGTCSWHKCAQQSDTHGTCSWHKKSAQQSDT